MNAWMRYLGPVPGSVLGKVNWAELWRAVTLGTGTGGAVKLLLNICGSVAANASTIFPDSTVAGLAVALLGFAVDVIRRRYHFDPAAGPAL